MSVPVDASIGIARFPRPIPIGWFSIGRLDELPSDLGSSPCALRAVGRELVAWHDGESHRVADAFCPHLGAHLGIGGQVADGCIVCPFHGWTFDGAGANATIPFSERTNDRARLRMYPTAVADGHLRLWHHPDPTVAPLWEVPSIVDPSMIPCGTAEWTVASAWQELAENSVDMAHFVSVHGAPGLGEVVSATAEPARRDAGRRDAGDSDVRVFDVGGLDAEGSEAEGSEAEGSESPDSGSGTGGPIRHVVHKTVYETAGGLANGELRIDMYGPGTSVTTFAVFGTITLLTTTTPIDDGHCVVRMSFFRADDEVSAAVAPAFVGRVREQFEQDVPIWENKRFVESPALAPYEKPITAFRAWAAQFYVPPAGR